MITTSTGIFLARISRPLVFPGGGTADLKCLDPETSVHVVCGSVYRYFDDAGIEDVSADLVFGIQGAFVAGKLGGAVAKRAVSSMARTEAMAASGAAAENVTVIGCVKDLQKLGPGEKSLLDRLPNLGNPKGNWKQNSGVLREEMKHGRPIRDASPGDTGGQFLNAERNLLRDRGWTFDPNTNLWMPPKG
jgi:hypothetical protein